MTMLKTPNEFEFSNGAETISKGGYMLVLDPNEIVKDDPGAGTPAMVYGPRGSSATYWCAKDTGELSNDREYVQLPQHICAWLNSDAVETAVDEFLAKHDA